MQSLSRLAVMLGAPALLLAAVSLAAWLALGAQETGFGPMRLMPLPAQAPQASLIGGDDPPTTQLEKMSPLQAQIRNALLPFSHGAHGAALAWRSSGDPQADALECMTQAVYYEAGREPEIGKRAVAQVIVNRSLSSPFPNTICGVVQQGVGHPGCQFTFMCDGSLARRPDPQLWLDARRIAAAALAGETEPLVGGATHYHADYVFPTWAPTMAKVVKIGAHIFYRWPVVRSRPRLDTLTSDAAGLLKQGDPPTLPQSTDAFARAQGAGIIEAGSASVSAEISEKPVPSAPAGPTLQQSSETSTSITTPSPKPASPLPVTHERRAIPERRLDGIPA